MRASSTAVDLEGFTRGEFSHDDTTHVVYRRGTGPGVVVIHEVPGITPLVARFGCRVADAGFPSLFGDPGRPESAWYRRREGVRVCVSREFAVMAAHRASPVTHWLRALCRSVHAECGGRDVGAIGMCLTGNFALALMVEPCVMAPVLSQPSLPVPIGAARRKGLHVSDADVVQIKRRVREEGACVLAMRFTLDPAVPAERVAHLRDELGPSGCETIEIDSRPGNPQGIRANAHSVVTRELVDHEGHPTHAAVERVLAFFRERLPSASRSPEEPNASLS